MRKICSTTFICTYLYVNSGTSQVEIVVKNTPVNAGDLRDMSSIPGLGRSPGEGNGNPLHYSCLENAMDRGPWWSTVHTAAKRQAGPRWFSTHRHTYANSAWNTTFKIQSDWKTMFNYIPAHLLISHSILFPCELSHTSWQIDGETMETVADFIFLGSKITADCDTPMKLKDAFSLEEKLWQTKTVC